ncbi:regulator of chromosome condensation 1/beta-lactamase-inhibitor protein II [Jimgerdemannia flammicorona]|uniref:Regulator of chromosome condensation 1/beta-lactamase-inhibitor protein II n=1 Tax=Jimgerdemannia flammicorona TaxID=994334 RepID=A0A433D3U4_9FUNG|nr:regulator of chromosome condensation 1/beta-lactamase-inhibitor protein II [Jimgerdemannia flammicorona]
MRQLQFGYNIRVQKIYTGYAGFMTIHSDGSVRTWSDSPDALGRNGDPTIPTVVDFKGIKITDGGCGDSFMVALGSGHIFMWGSIKNTGFKVRNKTVNKHKFPLNITRKFYPRSKPQKFVQVAVGSNHGLAATERGCVYTWGDSSCGQSGFRESVRSPRKSLIPTRITKTHVVSSVICGDNNSFALGTSIIVAWGLNDCNQTGVGATRHYDHVVVPAPALLPMPISSIVQIAAGSRCTIVLQSNGRIVAFGDTYFLSGSDESPIELDIPHEIHQIAASDKTYLVLTKDGRVLELGRVVHYYCYYYHEIDLNYRVVQIAASPMCGMALTDNGDVITWKTFIK